MLDALRTKFGPARRRAAMRWRAPRLGVHCWIGENAYLDLIYCRFCGPLEPEPMTTLDELDAFTRLPAQDRLLWIHAEASYSWGRHGEAEFAAACRSYRRSLARWTGKGGWLAWTIHDQGLHLTDPDPARIAAIRADLGAAAQLVHVHSEAGRRVAVEEFAVDAERVVVVRHPSAMIVPAATVMKPITSDDRAVNGRCLLCFGHIKPYKNLTGLAAALESLGPHAFAALTIAGKVSGPNTIPEARLREVVAIDLQLRFIPEDEVAGLFAATDFLVLPYTESLTSGAAAFSMGFGVPVIAPNLGGMCESVPAENQPLIYAADDPDGLTTALRRARDMSPADYAALAAACRAFGKAIHPHRISAALMAALAERGLLPPG